MNEESKARLILDLRQNGILDKDILDVMEQVPRELFIPDTFQDHAYEDAALPIARGQTISQPFIVAKMTQALDMGPRMKVLEIGTGSGYQSVILSHFCRRVYSLHGAIFRGG
jgi:protein-L-isoaspartate(D-aspartate) O-methyltransferase